MKLARAAALSGIAAAVLGSLTIGVALPADAAAVTPLFPNTSSAMDYALTVRGMDIYAAQPDTARAAWSAQLGRVAAADANIYRAAQVYGQLDPLESAQVIPLNGPVDASLNGKLTAGMKVSNGATSWVGKGFRFPAFAASPLSSIRTAVGSPVGQIVALTSFMQRADIANGVASWVGVDANGAVCSDPVAGGNNPINWITGQNCDQWRADQALKPNLDVVPGQSSLSACSVQYPSACAKLEFTGTYTSANSGNHWGMFCMSGTGWPSDVALASGAEQDDITNGQGNWSPIGVCGGSVPFALGWGPIEQKGPVDNIVGFYMDNKAYRLAHGNPAATAVTNASSDPDRQVQCTMYGSSGNVTNGLTASFKESTLVGGQLPAPTCTPLPNGENPNRIVLTETGGAVSNVLYDKSQTAAATDYNTKYSAACGTGATQHSCLLDLVQISNGISCFSATATCTDWMHDPARDTKYQCQYGGQNEPMQQCYVYANTFDPAKRAAGNPYADPLTGNDPGQGTGSSLDTQTMGNPAGSVIQPDGSVASCWGGTDPGAFNPVSWIVRGGQCLLNWAFVPRPLVVQSQMTQLATGWDATGPGKLAAAVNGWHIAPVVTGCSTNLPFPVPMIGKTISVPIIQACPGTPMGDFAPWVRGLVSASLAITAAFAVKRIVSSWVPS